LGNLAIYQPFYTIIFPGIGFALPFLNINYMNTQEFASRFVKLCREGDFEKVQKEMYAKDAISIEPHATPAFEKETKGLDAILEKGKKWAAMVEEYHEIKVSEPLVADNSFAVTMFMSLTMKERGKMDMTELCVYQVKDGKIVSESFTM
jgi:hypothetical protein